MEKLLQKIAEQLNIVIDGISDNAPISNELLEYPILPSIPNNCENLFISIEANINIKIIAQKSSKFRYHTLICTKDQETVVMTGVSINSEANIGKHCIINTNVRSCIVKRRCKDLAYTP